MLAECGGAAEAADIDYLRLVYPSVKKQMSLPIPIPLRELCRLAEVSRAGFYRWKAEAPATDPCASPKFQHAQKHAIRAR